LRALSTSPALEGTPSRSTSPPLRRSLTSHPGNVKHKKQQATPTWESLATAVAILTSRINGTDDELSRILGDDGRSGPVIAILGPHHGHLPTGSPGHDQAMTLLQDLSMIALKENTQQATAAPCSKGQ